MGQSTKNLLKERPTPQKTLCIILKENKILLGMKKRGFGVGKYNGFGGGLKDSETLENAAIRELREESGLIASERDLNKVGELDFYFPHKPEFNQTVHVYLVNNYSSEPTETEEMKFQFFSVDKIPYKKMWDDDKYWLPLILKGKKLRARFVFKEQSGENIVDYKHIKTILNFN